MRRTKNGSTRALPLLHPSSFILHPSSFIPVLPFTKLAHLSFAPRLGVFLLALAALWLPYVAIVYQLVDDANTISLLVMPVLFLEFFGLVYVWGRRVYQIPQIFQSYGLERSQPFVWDLLQGLGTGVTSLVSLFLVQTVLGWVVWQAPADRLMMTVLEGLLVALGFGLAEETIFRGWLLDELQRDYSPAVALWGSAIVFAGLHFIRPLDEILKTFPQFAGLLLLGLTLVWAKRATGRLGWPVGLHGGLTWGYYMVNVGQLIRYTGQVPEWVTGIGNNPLAGAIGIGFMGSLALWMWGRSRIE
jgi:uncharacterized protein